nr:hypothetical protein [Actinomycetales bacterium]
EGHIAADDLLWSETTGAWQPASSFPALFAAAPAPPRVVAAGAAAPAPGVRRRTNPLLWAAGLSLAVLAIAAIAILIWNPGDLLGRGGSAATPEAGAAPVGLTTWQDPPGRVVPLATGGSLLIPEGSLPEEATVTASLAALPLLPEGYAAIGPVYEISVDVPPEGPVAVRLPIPEGASDASELVILRVLDIGWAECLDTRVAGGELSAYTSAFSRFAVVQRPGTRPVQLAGEPELVPGERSTYIAVRDIDLSPPGSRLRAMWVVSGPLTLVSESDDGAIVQAASTPGEAFLEYYCMDAAQGVRWYGALPVRVAADSDRLAGGFVVSAVAQTALVNPGDTVNITAAVHGAFVPPIRWEWEYGAEQAGGRTTTGEGVSELSLPPTYYLAGREVYRIATVWATDASGRRAVGQALVLVVPDALRITLEGKSLLIWGGAPLDEIYRASATDGRRLYRWTWNNLPGIQEGSSDTEDRESARYVRFSEPGEHRVQVTVQDESGATATATLA